MADAGFQAVFDLFPENRGLILRLAGRSVQFHALCSDLQAVVVHLATLDREEDRREYQRLQSELELELSEWIGIEKPLRQNKQEAGRDKGDRDKF